MCSEFFWEFTNNKCNWALWVRKNLAIYDMYYYILSLQQNWSGNLGEFKAYIRHAFLNFLLKNWSGKLNDNFLSIWDFRIRSDNKYPFSLSRNVCFWTLWEKNWWNNSISINKCCYKYTKIMHLWDLHYEQIFLQSYALEEGKKKINRGTYTAGCTLFHSAPVG